MKVWIVTDISGQLSGVFETIEAITKAFPDETWSPTPSSSLLDEPDMWWTESQIVRKLGGSYATRLYADLVDVRK